MATMLQLLKKSGLKAKEAKQLNDYLKSIGVETVSALENIPTIVGPKIFGHDVYQLIASVRDAANKPDDPVPAKEEFVKEKNNGSDSNNQTEPTSD